MRAPGDSRNVAGVSDTATVVVEQTEKPSFTIGASAPLIDEGSPATISGTLYAPGTITPKGGVSVTLLGREAPFLPGNEFVPIAPPTVTDATGSYSFTVTPVHNIEYEVETTAGAPAHRQTAPLFEAVRDLVTIASSSTAAAVGGSVTLDGTVTPDLAGHAVELQQLGADGVYHGVASGVVSALSTYQFTWTFGTAGTKTFRAHISGGPGNVGGYSPPVALVVTLPPVISLPPAS